MRVVNLSRRPFLNRRPVARVAMLMWILGALVLATNAWLYAGYYSGTTKNRERLEELNAEIDGAEHDFDAVGQRLSQVALGERNQRAAFLNELIDQRTFPWSRLFDDLEDALSDDVYLTLVAPSVEADDPSKASRRPTPTRRITPREARERARQSRSQGGGGSSASSMPTPESANVEVESDIDIVTLSLQGSARSDESLLDFVDSLYKNERFVDPFLSTETPDEQTRDIKFSITVYYLLPRRTPTPTEADKAGESDIVAKAETGDDSDNVPVVEAEDPSAEADEDAPPQDASPRRPGTEDAKAGTSRSSAAQSATPPKTSESRGEADESRATRTTRGSERDSGRRSRQDIEEDLARQLEERDTRRRRPTSLGAQARGADGADPGNDEPAVEAPETELRETGAEIDDPGLTEPAASASPALRRLGVLAPPTTVPVQQLPAHKLPAPTVEVRT